jgi:hypothetical protein
LIYGFQPAEAEKVPLKSQETRINAGFCCAENAIICTQIRQQDTAKMDDRERIQQLEGELERRDHRIMELRQDLDEARDLIHRLEEHADDYINCIERWKEAFGMEGDGVSWTWEPWIDRHNKLVDDYNDLVRNWNKYLPVINQSQQPVGRPLGASEAQCTQVLRLRGRGKSLRWIAEETNLGLGTVRTVIDGANRKGRTMRKHRERVDIGPLLRTEKAQKRVRATLPAQAQRVVEEGRALIKEAKGLGR